MIFKLFFDEKKFNSLEALSQNVAFFQLIQVKILKNVSDLKCAEIDPSFWTNFIFIDKIFYIKNLLFNSVFSYSLSTLFSVLSVCRTFVYSIETLQS